MPEVALILNKTKSMLPIDDVTKRNAAVQIVVSLGSRFFFPFKLVVQTLGFSFFPHVLFSVSDSLPKPRARGSCHLGVCQEHRVLSADMSSAGVHLNPQKSNRSLEVCEVPSGLKHSTITLDPKEAAVTELRDDRRLSSFQKLVLSSYKTSAGPLAGFVCWRRMMVSSSSSSRGFFPTAL